MKKPIKTKKTAEKNPEKKPKTPLKKSFEEVKMKKYKKSFYTDDELDEPLLRDNFIDEDDLDSDLDLDSDDLNVEITDMEKFEEDVNLDDDDEDIY